MERQEQYLFCIKAGPIEDYYQNSPILRSSTHDIDLVSEGIELTVKEDHSVKLIRPENPNLEFALITSYAMLRRCNKEPLINEKVRLYPKFQFYKWTRTAAMLTVIKKQVEKRDREIYREADMFEYTSRTDTYSSPIVYYPYAAIDDNGNEVDVNTEETYHIWKERLEQIIIPLIYVDTTVPILEHINIT